MKASTTYEILAATLAMCGVLLLGFTYYPALNPMQHRLSPGPEIVFWQRYVFGTLIVVPVFCAAWSCNVKAIRMKGRDAVRRDTSKN